MRGEIRARSKKLKIGENVSIFPKSSSKSLFERRKHPVKSETKATKGDTNPISHKNMNQTLIFCTLKGIRVLLATRK